MIPNHLSSDNLQDVLHILSQGSIAPGTAYSQGKEYSKNVLFGSNLPYYIGLICVKYGLYKTDKDIPKYIKLHVDDGLQLMNKELRDNPNLNGYDYLIDKITKGLEDMLC